MAIWSKEVFAKNLRYYMEIKGINQRELAAIIDVSAPTLNEYLKAKKYPRIDKIERMANYFGILKSDLIEDKTDDRKEMQKTNEVIANIVVKLRIDKDFLSLVEMLSKLDNTKMGSVKELISAFTK